MTKKSAVLTNNAPQVSGRSRRGDGGDRGRAERRQGAGPDQHALAEHLAVEGHLPRIRARLRQEGQRHDRRRPQDRGAAGRRRGAGLRPARRGLEGHARRRPRRARLSLRQADRAGAVGLGPGLRDGRQHAARLAQVRRRQGAARQALRVDRRQRRLVPLRPDADAAARLVQEADHQGRRLQGPEVSAPSASRSTCSPAMGAAVNALPGGEIVSAMDRGLLDAAEFNNASSDRVLGFADVSKVCMLQSYHQNAEQFEIMFNKAKYDALPEKMRAIIANAVEAASQDMSWKAIDRYSQDYIELQTKDKVKFYKTPDAILQAAARDLRRGRGEEVGGESAVQGDRRVAARVRQARDAVGAGHGGQPPHGLRPLLRRRTAQRRRSDASTRTRQSTIREHAGWCFVLSSTVDSAPNGGCTA